MNYYLKRKGKILVDRNKILIKESKAKHKTKKSVKNSDSNVVDHTLGC